MTLRNLTVHEPEPEIETPAFFPHPCPALPQAVPDSRNEFFQEMKHEVILRA